MRTASARVAEARQGIFGVPARFMGPRIVLVATAAALATFGLVMIYSASSITALYSYGDASYFLVRQAIFLVAGAVLAFVISRIDYHAWSGGKLVVLWLLLLALLLAVQVTGRAAYGAKRWIALGPFTLQPSEFAKPIVVLLGVDLLDRYLVEHEFATFGAWAGRVILFVGLPLLAILLQPDKGTTGILVLTLLVMAYLAGLSGKAVGGCLGAVAVLGAAWSMHDSYSRDRIQAMLDPFSDTTNNSYQLVQGFYAFGSGGLFGRGIGMSRQKYNYLPMAYNDFIFAVVGEELGLVGTLFVIALFALFMWAGFRIAEEAPDTRGRILAGGATALFGIQLLLNVCGVLGLFPLSGKPVPFLSYGGSSVVANLILVGLILSVSRQSHLPETVYDRRRSQLRLADEEPRERGVRGSAAPTRTSVPAGVSRRSTRRESALGEREWWGSTRTWHTGVGSGSRGGWERRDLNGDPADRLWKHDDSQGGGRSRSHGGRNNRDR